MNRQIPRAAVLVVAAVAALLAAPCEGGDFASQSTFGSNFFFASPACQVKQFPTLEAVVPIPAILDPFENDLIPMFCQIQVSKEGSGVKKAKGSFSTQLVILDNNSGSLESFEIDSGKFKTKKDGFASFDFEIPAELFADGFESGDVSAWSYTRTDFSNKKQAESASMSCGGSGSQSQ